MNWTKGLVACGLALGLTISLATPSDAARRDGLNGSALIIDGNDIYQFPQLTLDYVNLVRFEMGADSATGEGRFVFGTKSFAMSLSAHRQDFTNGGANNAFGEAKHLLAEAAGAPWTMADLNFAFDLDGSKAGVRVAIGNAGKTTANDDVDATGSGNLVFVLGAGYSMAGEDLTLDLGMHFALSAYGSVSDGDTVQSGSNINFRIGGRGFFKVDDELSIGFLAGIGLNSWGLANDDPDEVSSETDWSVSVAAGPVYNIKDKAQVAGYVGIALIGASADPNDEVDDDEYSSMTIMLPHVNLAAEIWIYDWLAFRGGVGYNYRINSSNRVANDDQEAEHTGSFAWTAGLGFKVDDFTFDGSLQSAWLTQGPDMLGGDSPAFLTVAANYSF